MLHYGKEFGTLQICACYNPQIDIGFLLLAALFPLYIFVDPFTGLVSSAFFGSLHFLSTWLFTHQLQVFGNGTLHFQVMMYLHIFAWLTQFVGHGIYEGRAPALLDNALLMFVAPFFMIFEVLNKAIGYKAKEVREWNKVVALEIKQFRDGKVKKRAE